MKVALYIRVSTVGKDQDPEVQLLQLRRYVEYQKWEIFDVYKDECGGRTPSRPGMDRLIEDAKARKFDTILVLRIDRIMRSVKHFYNLNEVLEAHGVKIVSAIDGLDYSTPIGKMVRGILLHVAEFEVEQLSQRTKEGLAKAREDGKVLGRRRVDIDIPRALALLSEGISKAKVAQMLGTNPATLNNRLREAGYVLNSTPHPETNGSAEKRGEAINSGPSGGEPSNRSLDSEVKP
jgi:site-specific DNA recombinase